MGDGKLRGVGEMVRMTDRQFPTGMSRVPSNIVTVSTKIEITPPVEIPQNINTSELASSVPSWRGAWNRRGPGQLKKTPYYWSCLVATAIHVTCYLERDSQINIVIFFCFVFEPKLRNYIRLKTSPELKTVIRSKRALISI